jgi:hypothetical protein
LTSLLQPKGEFTIVLDSGQMTRSTNHSRPGEADLALEFGELTETTAMGRRAIVNELAKRHHMTPREVYAAIESAKLSGK